MVISETEVSCQSNSGVQFVTALPVRKYLSRPTASERVPKLSCSTTAELLRVK
jgi:hypothetical protein